MGKLKKKKKTLRFGLQLDMNGFTSRTEVVPQTERKAQAFLTFKRRLRASLVHSQLQNKHHHVFTKHSQQTAVQFERL